MNVCGFRASKRALIFAHVYFLLVICVYYWQDKVEEKSFNKDYSRSARTVVKNLTKMNIVSSHSGGNNSIGIQRIETDKQDTNKSISTIVLAGGVSDVLMVTVHRRTTTRSNSRRNPNDLHAPLKQSSNNGTQRQISHCNCEPLHFDPAGQVFKDFVFLPDPVSGLPTGESLYHHHPNLPMDLLNSTEARCSLMPNIFDISWEGVHWQRLDDETAESYLLYSAFYDNRTSIDPPEGSVRMLALLKRFTNKLPWCHLWYEGQTHPVPSKVIRMDYVDWQKQNKTKLRTYVLSCPVQYDEEQTRGRVPTAVSLVLAPCERATNVVKVIGKPFKEISHLHPPAPSEESPSDAQFKVAVCGPALYYVQEDFATRIVEWLELLKALGVSQVFLYPTQGGHPNITKVLTHYEEQGFVELVYFHFPPPLMDEPLLRKMWKIVQNTVMFSMQNIYFTDCVLRFKDRYRFLVHFDPDELPVLLQHNTLPELVYDLTKKFSQRTKPPPAYKLPWVFFPLYSSPPSNAPGGAAHNLTLRGQGDLPTPSSSAAGTSGAEVLDYLTVLRSTRRLVVDRDPWHNNLKSIYDTHYVTGVFSHGALVCTWGLCPLSTSHRVSKRVAYTGHFRDTCDEKCDQPGATEHVPAVSKNRHQVLPKIAAVLKQLDLIP